MPIHPVSGPQSGRPALRRSAAFSFVLTLLVSLASFVGVGGQAAAMPAMLSAKGPVGWQTYRSMDGLAQLRPGEQTKQFSSADKAGANDDGFEGTHSCLRNEPDGQCVLAEAHGAGEISSMWFTYEPDTVAPIGDITVELDSRVVLQGSLQDIVNGSKGAPFEWPLVGNSADTMGGSVIKVPMPYAHSMRITTQNNPHFYHVDYRQFSDATGVRTFDPSDRAQDVLDRLRGFGVSDPKPPAQGAQSQGSGVVLPPLTGMGVPLPAGSNRINEIKLRLPQVVGSPAVQDDGRAFNAGGSGFQMAVAPDNDGVRLTRRFDPKIGDQRAAVFVDGQPVGEWRSGAPSPPDTWANQTIEIPPEVTRGKSRITVENKFISSSLDVNEFRYEAHSKVGPDWTRTDLFDLGRNHTHEEAVHGYQVNGERWEGLGRARYPSDPLQVAASDAVLEGLRLRISFDGQTTVDSPVGEFFGSGLGKHEARTLMHSIDVTDNGAFTSWWPMPYAQGAVVQLVNASGIPVTGGSIEVNTSEDRALSQELSPSGTLGYFHATSNRGDTVPGREWNFLSTPGQGVFYGVTTTMRGHKPPNGPGHQMNFLEGDERVYVDGSRSPGINGTGSEDFYESGWYFMDAAADHAEGVPYAMPQAGMVGQENAADGCVNVCLGASRLMMADAVPFSNALEFDIEHGPDSDEPANYSSTAYWYGKSAPSSAQTDLVDLGDDNSRALHGYNAGGEARGTLESTFEGKGDTTPVTAGTTNSTGPVTFTSRVDPGNSGLRLHRVSDQSMPFQRANVFIDDQFVGEWYQPLGNTHSRWLEDAFDVPGSATAGKQAVNVRIEPIAGAPAWSASSYRTLSHLGERAGLD